MFNNFMITQTPDCLPEHLGVLTNTHVNGSADRNLTATPGDSPNEDYVGSAFKICPHQLWHVDWSRAAAKMTPTKEYGYLTSPDMTYAKGANGFPVNTKATSLSLVGGGGGVAIPQITTARQSHLHETGHLVPSPCCYLAPFTLSTNDFPIIKSDTSVINRPAAANEHGGTQDNVMVLSRKNYHNSDPRGRVGSNQTTDLGSFTAFFVYLPCVNADGSGLSFPSNNSSTDTLTTFLYSNSAHIQIDDAGTKFIVKANSQSNVDVTINNEFDLMSGVTDSLPILYQKWDVGYYLSGAASNGNGNLVKEPIIWCVDVLNDKTGITLKAHQTYRRVAASEIKKEDRIDDHTTWWHSYIESNKTDINLYHNAIPAASDNSLGVHIYNQYGVPVGYETAQTSGVGKELARFAHIGSNTSSSTTTNLHGLHCETIVCPTPMSMARKLLMLKHLRTKWGIADSYANGKPFHD